MRNKISFSLNGKMHEVAGAEAFMMLAEYLRYQKGLTGTKVVCAEGDCGACSVLKLSPIQGPDYQAINSCIMPVALLDGSSIVTVEALAEDETLHEAQRAMVECHGSQCGFCTPGFVVALAGLCEKKITEKITAINEQEAKNCMTGNLCRCTGYSPIINAALDMDLKKINPLKDRYFSQETKNSLVKNCQTSVMMEHQNFAYYAPTTIQDALSFLTSHPDVRIIGSGTDLGVVHNKRKIELTHLMSLHLIPELYQISEQNNEITLGARVSLTELRHFLKDRLPEFAHYLDIFASPQIKNAATVVGNVANASPIGDTPPALMSLGAKIIIESMSGRKEIELSDFFVSYRKTKLNPGEFISFIKFPLPQKNQVVKFYKNSNRKDLDISAINLAMNLTWEDAQAKKIKDIKICAGGVAATTLRLKETEKIFSGQTLNQNLIDQASQKMQTEFSPLSDLRSSATYRRVVMENYFQDFFGRLL